MDLCSLDDDYRYHPLAALVDIGPQPGSQFHLMGFDPEQGMSRISKILHEVTHVAAMRTTRLGFRIARATSEILKDHKQIPDHGFDVPGPLTPILGAFSPLLEGLALYGQLDYEAESSDETLPFPLVHVASNNVEPGFSAGYVMRAAQQATIHEGLLDALFIGPGVRTSHYFAGYLYVKALAARLARQAPALAATDTMLPVLNRLICDHPLLEREWHGDATAGDLVREIHASLQALDGAPIARLAALLLRPDVRKWFDNWDIHAQLARPDCSEIILHTANNPLHQQLPSEAWYATFRHATNVHLTGWVSGNFAGMDEYGFALKSEGGQTQVLMPWLHQIPHLREAFEGTLSRCHTTGATVTVGNYLTLTRGQTGVAVWVDDDPEFFFPLQALDGDPAAVERDVITAGLALSPGARRRFAKGLRANRELQLAIGEASDDLLAMLISDPIRRMIARRDRLAAFMSEPSRTAWDGWPHEAVLFGTPYTPALTVDLFDAPGFPGFAIEDLMPRPRQLERLR